VFASKRVGAKKFEALTGHRWTKAHGLPVLDRALAWVACDLREMLPGGDHEIGIGEVVASGAGEEGAPLVFYGGRYTTVAS
jgi:3-hydroxy-9,10-secoandrosta-1,3,5(10)-triene-9,17-dione monooxygenase reductase component